MTNTIQIVCRTADAGGDLDPLRAWLSVPDLRGLPHLIFLVHGYNDTVEEATAAYRAFDDLQTAAVQAGRDWTFGAALVEFFWPGDATWGLARPAFYPWALPLADKSAAVLSDIVRDLCSFCHGELTVDLVSHSMGNRVTLRMLSLLQGIPGLHVRRSVHMASAVPIGRLETHLDELSRGLAVETGGGKAASFYSSGDDVLAYAFPLGETADFPQEGFLPVALGHKDWIAGHSWPNLDQRNASPAAHGQYWSGRAVQLAVHDVLDLGVTGSRSVADHGTPVAPDSASRILESRATFSRQVGNALD